MNNLHCYSLDHQLNYRLWISSYKLGQVRITIPKGLLILFMTGFHLEVNTVNIGSRILDNIILVKTGLFIKPKGQLPDRKKECLNMADVLFMTFVWFNQLLHILIFSKWMMPEYKCYWKVVSPDTKVAVAFGPVAGGKYGTDMSLLEGLHGRGDTYRTLLREATAALLNSYNSFLFPYPTLSVINRMNWALLGSPQQALMVALRFKRANTGVYGHTTCNFSSCS